MRLVHALQAMLLLLCLSSWPVLANEEFIALSYHDVQDELPASSPIITLKTDELVAQFSWLKEHNYHPVSLSDLIAARDGKRPLPDKAVLLSFDDGYLSMYTRVYPLLKLYNFPAVLALVTDWMVSKPGESIHYDDNRFSREKLLTWEQIREMEKSGLVEVVSHSHHMHLGLTSNPQGNEQAAAVSRTYDKKTQRYEEDKYYLKRLKDDLQRSTQVIEREIGRKPRAVVWPYGAYNQPAIEAASSLGMPITLSLDDGRGSIKKLQAIPRYLVSHGMRISDYVWMLRNQAGPQPLRVAHVDLDYVYDADPAQQEKNLGLLIERISKLEINTVFLQAYADPDGDGSADAVYFPNRHVPVRADLFNRAAHQLRTRAFVKVYAWMPVLAYKLPESHPVAALTIQHHGDQHQVPIQHYYRLSPFYPEVRKVLLEIYEDLAKHADFAGILFHDDAYFTESEDSNPAALAFYQKDWGLPGSIAEIKASPEHLSNWTRRKTAFLLELTDQLATQVRYYRPAIKTARNIYAQVILEPEAETWFAQSLPDFYAHYDYAAVMAMPYLEGAANPKKWLAKLADRVTAIPGAVSRTVFELQSRDWNEKIALNSDEIAADMGVLRRRGISSFGYYPDDFINSHPDMNAIKPEFSLRANPYR